MFDAIGQLFQALIDFLEPIVLPDWKALVDLFPVLLLIGVVGPLLSLLILGWVVYFVGKPRSRIPYTAPVAASRRDRRRSAGLPRGRAVLRDDRLIYPFGETRCEIDKRDLAVVCPKCSTGRQAYIDTCGTCGLVLKIDRTVPALQPAGPPPGGAAAA